MNVVPEFRFTFCFDGADTAVNQAQRTQGCVVWWEDDKRMIAISVANGVAKLPYDTREEVAAVMATLKHFVYTHA